MKRRIFRIAVLFFAGVISISAKSGGQQLAEATPVRIADQICSNCHREIFEKYLRTPMANASGPAMKNVVNGTLNHRVSGAVYNISTRNQQAVLSIKEARDPQADTERKLDYFLGSGHLGITYLYSVDGYLFESPVAYYAASRSYDMKPGLESVTAMPPALPMQANCLRCHMSAVQQSDPGTINHYKGLAFLHTGITCEACHGDARQHISSGGKVAVTNPSKLDAEKRGSVCISCHLEGDIAVNRANMSPIDYKPGDSISDFISYFVYQGKDATRRGVSEVEQLSMSTCKRMSGDKMSCTSCHDPHDSPGLAEKVGFYRKKCLVCHSSAAFAAEHHPENPDCTSCHMPHNGAENIPHVAWTDHRILKISDSSSGIKNLGEGEDLTPIFSPHVTNRDVALAYYQAVMEGNFQLEPKAYRLLTEIRPEISGDKEALTAIGILSEKRGDYRSAADIFQQVLKLDPENLTALSSLGTLRAKSGNLGSAAVFLKQAFERNEDLVGLAKNLAQVQCLLRDSSAQSTLQKTLQYNPGLQDVEQLLTNPSFCTASKQ